MGFFQFTVQIDKRLEQAASTSEFRLRYMRYNERLFLETHVDGNTKLFKTNSLNKIFITYAYTRKMCSP